MNKTISFGPLRTSVVELRDITKAWLVLSLAFAFIYSGTHLVGGSVMGIWSFRFLMLFGVSLFTAGLGFLLKEF